MPITIHIQPALLERVDRRATGLGLSRSRYISGVLERALLEDTAWSQRLLAELREARDDEDGRRAIDEMMDVIRRERSSKSPPRL
jgi:metal-responsive CopG/Arc/MetJ family transcriptional regulator